MAKIKLGAIIGQINGKLNNDIYFKNRYGYVVRNNTTPFNPQSSYQQIIRDYIKKATQEYGNISNDNRLLWENFAKEIPFYDCFGDLRYYTGQIAFIKVNVNLQTIYEAMINTPIYPTAIEQINSIYKFDFDIVNELTDLRFNPATTSDYTVHKIYCTPPVKPSINNVKGQYRFISLIQHNVSIPIDFYTEYVNRFFKPTDTNYKIFIKLIPIDNRTGLQGVPIVYKGNII